MNADSTDQGNEDLGSDVQSELEVLINTFSHLSGQDGVVDKFHLSLNESFLVAKCSDC
jgi:hypothetical protein